MHRVMVTILMVGMVGWSGCAKDKAKPSAGDKTSAKPEMTAGKPEMAATRPRPVPAMGSRPVTLPTSHRWRLTANATGVNPCAEVPAAVLAPSELGLSGRALFLVVGLAQALFVASVLLWVQRIFGDRRGGRTEQH